jgi:hypothetical protein
MCWTSSIGRVSRGAVCTIGTLTWPFLASCLRSCSFDSILVLGVTESDEAEREVEAHEPELRLRRKMCMFTMLMFQLFPMLANTP